MNNKELFSQMREEIIAKQKKTTWGVSVYPEHSTVEKDKAYLKLAAQYGFTRVFTCLLSVGDDIEQIKKEFTDLNMYAHELGMQVMFDVNKEVFDKFGVVGNDLSVFKEMHADGIRLDMDLGAEGDALMTQNPQGLLIEINTSTAANELGDIIAAGANMEKLWTCHNFYPQLYSGIGIDTYMELSQAVKAHDTKVASFISSNEPNTWGPWPVFEGLVTIEEMRDLPIDYQARYMMATKVSDDILIGNAYASEAELKTISALPNFGMTLKIDEQANLTEQELAILYGIEHVQRELSDFIRRDFVTRFVYGKEPLAPNNTPDDIAVGDVIVVNDNLAHYRGELQIATRPLKNKDHRYNLLGKLSEDEMALVAYLEPRDLFRFVK